MTSGTTTIKTNTKIDYIVFVSVKCYFSEVLVKITTKRNTKKKKKKKKKTSQKKSSIVHQTNTNLLIKKCVSNVAHFFTIFF